MVCYNRMELSENQTRRRMRSAGVWTPTSLKSQNNAKSEAVLVMASKQKIK